MHASTSDQIGLTCSLMRGGTSKAAFFAATDLPPPGAERDALLLAAMGHGDARQIDGIGGGTPLTTKLAIVAPSQEADIDVDYLFGQVVASESRIDYTPTCGNILAAVGPYAIERGWVTPAGDETPVRIFMLNTQACCTAMVPTVNGKVRYAGDVPISGVPGTAAPIYLRFTGIIGSSCGSLFPTGQRLDRFHDTDVTCIDHGMPVVIIRAADVGVSGYEPPAELDADTALKQRIERIRLSAGECMGLGDVTDKVVPKVTLVTSPRQGGTCCTRTFIPHRCHDAIGVLGAVSVATAALYPDTVIGKLGGARPGSFTDLVIEHPTGDFGVRLFHDEASGDLTGAALLRTARALFHGQVMVPATTQKPLAQVTHEDVVEGNHA